MENRVEIVNVLVSKFEDEFLILAYDAEGREYTHAFVCGDTREQVRPFAARVLARGNIDLRYWGCRTPYGSAAWDVDGMEATLMDDEERYHRGV